MNMFKYMIGEMYSKAEMGTIGRGPDILPDPLTSPSEEIDAMVAKLNDDDKDTIYRLGHVKLSGGTNNEPDRNVLLWATDHFYGRFLHQRIKMGGKEYKLKPAELDFKFRGNRSLAEIRDRDLLKKLLSKTAQKILNFYGDKIETSFTAFSDASLQGMGCYTFVNNGNIEMVFTTFLPHKADKPTNKFQSIFILIDDPMKQ